MLRQIKQKTAYQTAFMAVFLLRGEPYVITRPIIDTQIKGYTY